MKGLKGLFCAFSGIFIMTLDIETTRSFIDSFREKHAEIPEAMLASEYVANALVKWIKDQSDNVDKEWDMFSLWGTAIKVIHNSDAYRIPQLGLDHVLLGSYQQIYDLLDRYGIKPKVKGITTEDKKAILDKAVVVLHKQLEKWDNECGITRINHG